MLWWSGFRKALFDEYVKGTFLLVGIFFSALSRPFSGGVLAITRKIKNTLVSLRCLGKMSRIRNWCFQWVHLVQELQQELENQCSEYGRRFDEQGQQFLNHVSKQ